jgi:hypothetical protein
LVAHIAELRGGTGDDGLRQERVALADEGMVGGFRVRRQGADRDAAVRRLDLGQLQTREVHELVGTFDVLFHQIEDIRPARQEFRQRVRRDGAGGGVGVARAHVPKRSH